MNKTRWMTTMALCAGSLALALSSQARAAGPKGQSASDWSAQELPLPLAVKTADDLRIKALAERHYLIFNLLGHGKVAWDAGDWASAAARFEELLKVPGLDLAVENAVRPLAKAARARAGGASADAAPLDAPSDPGPGPGAQTSTQTQPAADAPPPKPKALPAVSGSVSGGEGGPGGSVVVLRPSDGRKVEVRPAKGKVMLQKDKQFSPHVLVVPQGSAVSFKNVDPLFHNAFSLSATKRFDTDLYNQNEERTYTFDKPGVVEVLCNIHASMLGYVVVVDTPYFATVGATGTFTIKNVPPGAYDVEVWHESATSPTKSKLTVSDEGARASLSVGADKKQATFPPDKYGKPRQTQLGY